ncbi:unnamed protein product, partial [Musa textilis]
RYPHDRDYDDAPLSLGRGEQEVAIKRNPQPIELWFPPIYRGSLKTLMDLLP